MGVIAPSAFPLGNFKKDTASTLNQPSTINTTDPCSRP